MMRKCRGGCHGLAPMQGNAPLSAAGISGMQCESCEGRRGVERRSGRTRRSSAALMPARRQILSTTWQRLRRSCMTCTMLLSPLPACRQCSNSFTDQAERPSAMRGGQRSVKMFIGCQLPFMMEPYCKPEVSCSCRLLTGHSDDLVKCTHALFPGMLGAVAAARERSAAWPASSKSYFR
jgi:hypothetical protein